MNDNQKQQTDAELNKFLHVDVLGKCWHEPYMSEEIYLNSTADFNKCRHCNKSVYFEMVFEDINPSYTTGGDGVRALIFSEIEKAGLMNEVLNKLTNRVHYNESRNALIKATVSDILTAFKITWEAKG